MTRLLAFLLAAAVCAAAPGQSSTVFTYQGELMSGGSPANGPHNMEFRLWNAASGGAQVGNAIARNGVPVASGLFTVDLDFGAAAFDNSGRWLEIGVNGFTLDPRTRITRSPYSIQTRGIFVDAAENVGVGTTAPMSKLHVAGSVRADGDVASHNPAEPLSLAFLGWGVDSRGVDMARIRVGGNGPGASNGLDIQRTGDRSMMRLTGSGNVGIGTTDPLAKLHVAGDGRFAGRLGVGDPSSYFGQLTVVDSGSGVPFAIDAEWASNSFPTIFASNSGSGGVLWAEGNSDVSLGGGGTLVLGSLGGANIGIDNNEIMARNGGSPATLYLNADGGDVKLGANRTHPAHAYARIREDGSIVSRSSNVTSVSHWGSGGFLVRITGGVLASDIIIATDSDSTDAAYAISAGPSGGDLLLQCFHGTFGWERSGVSFVIYRP